MSVEELSVLHRRYIELSDRFRAAWAFHQFVGSLYKVLRDGEQPPYPVDFQSLYGDLKAISHNLNTSSAEVVNEKSLRVGEGLEELTAALLAEDSKISPSALRKFFLRVKSTDDKILTQLVKFYLYAYEGDGWPVDRLDKIDFLITRLAQQEGDGVGSDSRQLREVLRGLWHMVVNETGTAQIGEASSENGPGDGGPSDDELVAERRSTIQELRREVMDVGDLDELNDHRLVPRYRELKHSLGDLFFQPALMMEILETNLMLGRRIPELYHQEERRIFAQLEQVFSLEREAVLDSELEEELSQFRSEIESFEDQLNKDGLKLEELAGIRARVRSLMPRLEELVPSDGEGGGLLGAMPATEPVAVGRPDELVGAQYERILNGLEGSNPEASARAVALRPDLFPLRLEPREVIAYRRLSAGSGDENRMERFILEGAALRIRLMEEAAEVRSLLDDTMAVASSPVIDSARRTVALGDRFLRLYAHYIGQQMLASQLEEAQHLQVLRIRMMREFSGVWLLVNKPR